MKEIELFRKVLADIDKYTDIIHALIADGYEKNKDIIFLLVSVIDRLDQTQIYIDFRETDHEECDK